MPFRQLLVAGMTATVCCCLVGDNCAEAFVPFCRPHLLVPGRSGPVSRASSTCGGPAVTTTPASPTTCLRGVSQPFAVIVQAEIQPERMEEFLDLIGTNARETRKESGCLRFDVLRSQDNPSVFFFYELYTGPEAIDHHKMQPHYNLWADFKASGGTVSSTSHKTDGEFVTE
jgi:(4S)-4-hydroxy-5-phosphonooxypentane-2,3-dione isomerase